MKVVKSGVSSRKDRDGGSRVEDWWKRGDKQSCSDNMEAGTAISSRSDSSVSEDVPVSQSSFIWTILKSREGEDEVTEEKTGAESSH